MNRAVRRAQRAAEAKQKAAEGRPSKTSALPRTGTSPRPQRQQARGGILSWRPRFVMDIVGELRKVVWPSREDTFYMAVVVIIVTILFGALLGGIDFFFAWAIDKLILDSDALLR